MNQSQTMARRFWPQKLKRKRSGNKESSSTEETDERATVLVEGRRGKRYSDNKHDLIDRQAQ